MHSQPPTNRQAGNIDAGDVDILQLAAQHRDNFLSKMDDDFNSGAAISEIFELVRALNKFADQHDLEGGGSPQAEPKAQFQAATRTLKELTAILGLFQTPPAKMAGEDDGLVEGLMQILIGIRASAREHKDFGTADRVRDELAKLGITLEDRKGETGWRRDA